MDDLIRRGALLAAMGLETATKYGNKSIEQQHNSYSTWMSYEIADEINGAPSVDAVEVVHAGWIEEPEHIPHCSRCGLYSDDADYGRANYCPGCGARMDAQTDGEKEAKQDG